MICRSISDRSDCILYLGRSGSITIQPCTQICSESGAMYRAMHLQPPLRPRHAFIIDSSDFQIFVGISGQASHGRSEEKEAETKLFQADGGKRRGEVQQGSTKWYMFRGRSGRVMYMYCRINKQRAVSIVHRFRNLAQGTNIYNITAGADVYTQRVATFHSTLLSSCCCRPRWSRFPSLYRYTPRRRTMRHHLQRRSISRTRSTTPFRLRAHSTTTLTQHCVAALPSPEATMRHTTLCATTGTSGKTRLNSDDPILGLWQIPRPSQHRQAICHLLSPFSIPLAPTAMQRAEPNSTARSRTRATHPASLRYRCSLPTPSGSRQTTALYKGGNSLGCVEGMSMDAQEVKKRTGRLASRVDLCGAPEVQAKVRFTVSCDGFGSDTFQSTRIYLS